MSETVTIERLERGLALCAYLVVRDGRVAVPLFERLERELAAMRRQEDTVDRAKKLLENTSRRWRGTRRPCSGSATSWKTSRMPPAITCGDEEDVPF
jgi:hypothetical protein